MWQALRVQDKKTLRYSVIQWQQKKAQNRKDDA